MSVAQIIKDELLYQQQQIKLIPSENYTSPEVMNAVGSVLMNKYAENYPGKRYYQGNRNMDKVERLCKKLALETFGLSKNEWRANVQATLGSIANLAVYNSVIEPGDTIMGMYLPDGGHLSHGWKLDDGKNVSFTSKIFKSHFYHVSKDTQTFDYDEIEKVATKVKPKVLISGGTAYPRTIDHKRLGEIAQKIGAYYLADIAHEAGLVAAGVHPSPFPYADFVTMTSRKTLRGPIGAIIICRKKFIKKVNRAVFPGLQGGPQINSIAGIATALEEANTPEFKKYSQQVLDNAQAMCEEFIKLGYNLISGGTDKHLLLLDIRNKQPDGLIAAELLETVDIIANKNTIPYDDTATPWRPSGVRLGTPSITTRGMKEKESKQIVQLIDQTLSTIKFDSGTKGKEIREMAKDNKEIQTIREEVHLLTDKFQIYEELG